MNRRSLSLALLLMVALALPLTASQFVELPFDRVARQASVVVRATVGPVTGAWEGDVIFSSANLEVSSYIAGNGPRVLRVREAGGTVGDYTQEAIGFPELREGEEVVLFLSPWEDGNGWRIEAYNQGKYLVKERGGKTILTPDAKTQGHERLTDETGAPAKTAVDAETNVMTLDELTEMVTNARRASGGRSLDPQD